MYIDEIIIDYLKQATGESDVHLEHPANTKNGEYSSNIAMTSFVEKRKVDESKYKNPRDLAEEILTKLQELIKDDEYIKKVEIAGPGFINFFLSDKFFIDEIGKILNSKSDYGKPSQYLKGKVSLEHTQVNPNKAPHIGHLRNAVIGDSITRILRFMGYDVKVQYYQNDAGLQIASIVLAYKKGHIKPSDYKTFIDWASVAYVDIEERIKENPEIAKEREEIQLKIASQNGEVAETAKEITDKILFETIGIFNGLGIYYDLVVNESDILSNLLWEKTFEILKKSDSFYLAEEGERKACWLVKMPEGEDKVIVRSNGVPTYTGNDIAYHLWKFGLLDDFKYIDLGLDQNGKPLYSTTVGSSGTKMDDFSNADKIVNIIDTTQTYPQESVKQALRILGYVEEAENYNHVNYGFVFLSPNSAKKLGIEVSEDETKIKISGRRGTVLSVTSFTKLLSDRLSELHDKSPSIEAVAKGALKFEMLKYDTYQDIIFDIDSALDQKGFSAPYLQYTYARALSLVNKANSGNSNPVFNQNIGISDLERDVLRILSRYHEVIGRTYENFAPHYLCTYLFELSQSFNSLYNSQTVIGADNEEFLLSLSNSVINVLSSGLGLLGIDAPDKM